MNSCPRHKHCSYTGTEPRLCPICHASTAKCAGAHGGRPVDGWGEHNKRGVRVEVATGSTATLKPGQYYDPCKQALASTPVPELSGHPSEMDATTRAEWGLAR